MPDVRTTRRNERRGITHPEMPRRECIRHEKLYIQRLHTISIITKRKKKEKKRRLKIYARSKLQSMYWMVRVASVKIRKSLCRLNLRSLRLFCRRTILYVLIGYLSIINWIISISSPLVKKRGRTGVGATRRESRRVVVKVKFPRQYKWQSF